MTAPFNRLTEIDRKAIFYTNKDPSGPAWKNAPEIIRKAVCFKELPKPKELTLPELYRYGWPVLFALALSLWSMSDKVLAPFHLNGPLPVILFSLGVPLIWLPYQTLLADRRSNTQLDELFGRFSRYPDVYLDEIIKLAVARLPEVDFYGNHKGFSDRAKPGKYENEVIRILEDLGIKKVTTVENRGRPFLIHQYELTELKRGKWENGDSKNYVLDIAILWPERRIKFNLEIDDPRHGQSDRKEKDVARDATLNERGWFTRRFKHDYLTWPAKTGPLNETQVRKELSEVVSVVYFFARYADNQPLGFLDWLGARMQNDRRSRLERARMAKSSDSQSPSVQKSS